MASSATWNNRILISDGINFRGTIGSPFSFAPVALKFISYRNRRMPATIRLRIRILNSEDINELWNNKRSLQAYIIEKRS